MTSPQCFENPPDLNLGVQGAGTVQEIGALKSYVAGPHDSKFAIILISDVFGKNPTSNFLSFNLFYTNQ